MLTSTEETKVRQYSNILGHLYPNGVLQERVFPFVYYLAVAGDALKEMLVQNLEEIGVLSGSETIFQINLEE